MAEPIPVLAYSVRSVALIRPLPLIAPTVDVSIVPDVEEIGLPKMMSPVVAVRVIAPPLVRPTVLTVPMASAPAFL